MLEQIKDHFIICGYGRIGSIVAHQFNRQQVPYVVIERNSERLQVAIEEGCGWLDLFQAMGGSGSIKRFDKAGLMHDDRVHPKGRGLDVLGQLITDDQYKPEMDSLSPGWGLKDFRRIGALLGWRPIRSRASARCMCRRRTVCLPRIGR